jgi:hypothetical protein
MIMRENCYLREKIDNFINYGTNADMRFDAEDKGRKIVGERRRRK